jgi:hypothetical protein
MKDKHFRIPEDQAKDFEVLCVLLGIPERHAGQMALREWVRRNRNQVTLETWTEARGQIEPTNRALIGVQLTIVKAELSEIIQILPVIQPEYRLEVLRKVQKLLPTARNLVEETADKELADMLTAVAEEVAEV